MGNREDYCDLHNAALRYTNLSRSQLARLCQSGHFKTAHKQGSGGKTSKWFIAKAELLFLSVNQRSNPYA